MRLAATEMGACWFAPRSLRWPNRSRVRPCVCNFRLLMPPATADKTMEKLVSLAKRRGFVFQSSEIYGGLGSVWDYGPLGVELKKNIKERWWRSMVHERHDIEGLDAAILMHPKVWEASGHVSGFTDPLVDCKHCKTRFRADDPRTKGKPGSETEWFEFWRAERMSWVKGLGIRDEKLRWHQHDENELAHYAKDAYDIQYEFPFGWQEFEGIHNRTDFDLSNHQKHAGKKLDYLDPKTNERFIPYVVETSAGADRTTLVVLCDAYREEEVRGEEAAEGGEQRVVLKLKPSLAPLKAAVFPLVNKDGMPELAHRIHDDLRRHFNVFYDNGGSIGRRYRRQDEAGTPFGITIDGQSTQDQTVTVRDRDTLEQDRVAAGKLVEYLTQKLAG